MAMVTLSMGDLDWPIGAWLFRNGNVAVTAADRGIAFRPFWLLNRIGLRPHKSGSITAALPPLATKSIATIGTPRNFPSSSSARRRCRFPLLISSFKTEVGAKKLPCLHDCAETEELAASH